MQSEVCIGIMRPQNRKSPNCGNFEIPTWESLDKKTFGCDLCGELQSIYYKGEGGDFPPSPGRGESCVSELPMARPNTKSAPIMH